jgi:hypothetical protein
MALTAMVKQSADLEGMLERELVLEESVGHIGLPHENHGECDYGF